ncbi:MAG: hypothetical protein LPK88_07020, partial [Alphaproteobacteria bacterium]|nr:hypothetical protein [Alphaproteobacteria bacterium]
LVERMGPQLPMTFSWRQGADRSLDQNDLCWKWNAEVSQQMGDRTQEEVHAFNKLHFGVPIRREDAEFREVYDRVLKTLAYEDKLECMAAPLDLPVTRDMTVKQMTRFLDAVYDHWTKEGVALTVPPER